jgi:hypothetical protein
MPHSLTSIAPNLGQCNGQAAMSERRSSLPLKFPQGHKSLARKVALAANYKVKGKKYLRTIIENQHNATATKLPERTLAAVAAFGTAIMSEWGH